MAMGLCFPGQNSRKAYLPTRPECAVAWNGKILKLLADIEIILLVGICVQRFYLPIPAKQPLKSLLLKNGVTILLNTGFCHIPAGITIIC